MKLEKGKNDYLLGVPIGAIEGVWVHMPETNEVYYSVYQISNEQMAEKLKDKEKSEIKSSPIYFSYFEHIKTLYVWPSPNTDDTQLTVRYFPPLQEM